MFHEANQHNFDAWTDLLVDAGLQNLTPAREFEWKNSLPSSNFELLRRFQQFLDLTEEVVISGLCYMKKVASRSIKMTPSSIYKLAVVCIFIAHKFYSDFHYEIEDFSIASGITIKDILKLELITLDFLEYNLILTERDYYAVLLFGKF